MGYPGRVTLATLLIDALPEHRRADARAVSSLAETLDRQLGEIAEAWPRLHVDGDRYARRLAIAIERRAGEPMQRVIETMPAADLYLAAACLAGDPAALAAFRDTFVPSLRQALNAFDVPAATIDETIQRVLVMVLVGETAQIAGYTGRGRLRSWLRSVGVRTGRRLTGALHGPDVDIDELDALPAAVGDPELDVLRGRYADAVRAAFSAALGGLSERQRALLRQYHIDGLTIDQLGALYRINRATAARWVAGARLEIVSATRARLIASGGLPATEVDSIIRLVRSQLSISLHQLC